MDPRSRRRLDEFAGMIAEGLTDDQMVERTGLSLERVRQWRRRSGVVYTSGPPRLSPADAAQVHELTAEGWPATEIAEHLGWSHETIRAVDTAGQLQRNGQAWAAVQRWGTRNFPELMRDLRRQV